jgi:hypothetical protein
MPTAEKIFRVLYVVYKKEGTNPIGLLQLAIS